MTVGELQNILSKYPGYMPITDMDLKELKEIHWKQNCFTLVGCLMLEFNEEGETK
jgi:hypothetical protein